VKFGANRTFLNIEIGKPFQTLNTSENEGC